MVKRSIRGRLLRGLVAAAVASAAWLSVGSGEAHADHGFVCVGPVTIVVVTVPHACVG